MRTHTFNIYEFKELSEEAKENAISQYRNKQTEIFWSEEILQSLKGLFKKCEGITLKDYSLGEYNSSISIEFNNSDVEDFTGRRAIAWLENNLLYKLRIPYIGQRRKELAQYGQYYRPGMIKCCPFTGVCYDEDYLDSLRNDIKDGCDLKTAFEGLATTYQKILNNEIENQNSEEYIEEYFEANNYEFDEEGNII